MNSVLSSSTESLATIRLVIEVVTVLGGVAIFLWKIGKLGTHFVQRLDHLHDCVESVKTEVQTKVDEVISEQARLRESDQRIRDELFFLKGKAGVPFDQPASAFKKDET